MFIVPDAVPGKLIFPGSYNPPHLAHFEIADTATENMISNSVWIRERIRIGKNSVENTGISLETEFELSLVNATKPMLDLISLENRLKAFTGRGKRYRVWLTNAPLFVEKSRLFPNSIFVMGYDTAQRLHDPRYGDINSVMNELIENEAYFMVFGRDTGNGYEDNLEGFHEFFKSRAVVVRDTLHYWELSSSKIRNTEKTGSDS